MVPAQEDPCNFLFYEGLSQERASFLIPVFLFLGGYSHQRVTPHLHFLICAHFSRVRRGNACETPKVLFFKILCPPGRNVARGNACKTPKVPFFKILCPPGRNVARGNACEIPRCDFSKSVAPREGTLPAEMLVKSQGVIFQNMFPPPPGKERCPRKMLVKSTSCFFLQQSRCLVSTFSKIHEIDKTKTSETNI